MFEVGRGQVLRDVRLPVHEALEAQGADKLAAERPRWRKQASASWSGLAAAGPQTLERVKKTPRVKALQ